MEKVSIQNTSVIKHISDNPRASSSYQICPTIKEELKEENVQSAHPEILQCEKQFQCDLCDKSFARKRDIVRHKRIHNGETLYHCKICNKSYSRKDSLLEHEKNHTGERPFECSVCNKTFKRKCHLQQHGRYHTGEKPFQCVNCDKSFVTKGDLLRHTKIHTGEKPFTCDICTKVFAVRSYLGLHKKTHTGEKPFQCNICEKFFSRKFNRDTHQKIHAREKPIHCDVPLRLLYPLQSLQEPETFEAFYYSANTFSKHTTSALTLTKIEERITIYSSPDHLHSCLNLGLCNTKYVGYYTDIHTMEFMLSTLPF